MNPLKIVFAGTPEFALPSLQSIHASEHELIAVYTQPDRPAGRGRKLKASPIKEWAIEHEVPVYQPVNFKEADAVATLKSLDFDLMVVIAYGLILPESVLSTPRLGCINVHASILPRWRGASPIQHAILHQDKESGVTIMQMDRGMDTGDILSIQTCPIAPDETGGSLHDKLSQLATKPLLSTLGQISVHHISPASQDNALATYAPKILKQDAQINWEAPAKVIEARIRAYNPWPVAYTLIGDEPVKIYEASVTERNSARAPGTITQIDKSGLYIATSDVDLNICTIQRPGKRPVSINNLLNGGQINWQPGLKLS